MTSVTRASAAKERPSRGLRDGFLLWWRSERRHVRNPWSIAAILISLCVAAPILILLTQVFLPSERTWAELFQSSLNAYLINSAILLVGVGALTLVFGVGTAWWVATCDFPFRRVFEWALILPLAVPTYIAGFVYYEWIDASIPLLVWIRDHWGAETMMAVEQVSVYAILILLLSFVLYPYVYLVSRASFIHQSGAMLEAARTLGGSHLQTFFRVALPVARPAIVGGLSLALLETLNEYGAVTHFGIPTLTTGVFRAWLSFDDLPSAIRIADVLMTLVFLVMIFERLQRGRRSFSSMARGERPYRRYRVRGWRGWGLTALCGIPLAFGFLIPLAQLSAWQSSASTALWDPVFQRLATSSFALATAAATLIATASLVLAYSKRLLKTSLTTWANSIALLGYSIPGAVIAVAMLSALGAMDQQLNALLESQFDLSVGLLFSGSLFAILVAYLTRFLAVGLNAIEGGFQRVNPRLDDAAKILGSSALSTLTRIDLPLIRGSLAAAFILVFVDILKELPLTLILRPFNFETLATHAYNMASQDRLVETSTPSLVIVLTGVVPILMLNRTLRGDKG